MKQDMVFEKQDFSAGIDASEFDNCQFIDCNFQQADLSRIIFSDCSFSECNLSLADISGSSFQNVSFSGCKLLGLRFDRVNPFGFEVHFDRCRLENSVFYGLRLKNSRWNSSDLSHCDFTRSDLSGSDLSGCQLTNAVFDDTNLSKADLRFAINFSIDPNRNTIKAARFSSDGLSGLLKGFGIRIDQ